MNVIITNPEIITCDAKQLETVFKIWFKGRGFLNKAWKYIDNVVFKNIFEGNYLIEMNDTNNRYDIYLDNFFLLQFNFDAKEATKELSSCLEEIECLVVELHKANLPYERLHVIGKDKSSCSD